MKKHFRKHGYLSNPIARKIVKIWKA